MTPLSLEVSGSDGTVAMLTHMLQHDKAPALRRMRVTVCHRAPSIPSLLSLLGALRVSTCRDVLLCLDDGDVLHLMAVACGAAQGLDRLSVVLGVRQPVEDMVRLTRTLVTHSPAVSGDRRNGCDNGGHRACARLLPRPWCTVPCQAHHVPVIWKSLSGRRWPIICSYLRRC